MQNPLVKSDFIGTTYDRSEPFLATLAGVRAGLKRFFGVAELPIVTDNDVKLALRNKFDTAAYPFCYLTFNNIGLKEDAQNPKTIRRHGLAYNINGTNSTVDKYYFFPIKFGMELHYVGDNFRTSANFILRSMTLLASEALNFKIRTGSDTLYWKVRVTSEGDIQFPRADRENEVDPSGYDIVLNLTVESYTGVVRETAKINNFGKVQFDFAVGPEGDVADDDGDD